MIYKRRFKEEDSLSDLTDVELVDKIIKFFEDNPYPKDHEQFHKYIEDDLGIESSVAEAYVYAIVFCFISGGNFIKSGKKKEDFDEKEIAMGYIVEGEHVDKDNDNPVVKKISDYIRYRIDYDHLTDNNKYYSQAKEGTLQIEELVDE
ncbi:MAG: hypothetical protein WC554_10590 [Clostridia bacterium]